MNDWHTEQQSVSKPRTYKSFESDFDLQKYVAIHIPEPQFSSIRRGVLPIRLETGRFRGKWTISYVHVLYD